MGKLGCEKSTLLLALIVGLSIKGSYAALFYSVIPFSIFPFIALAMTAYYGYQCYQNGSIPRGMAKLMSGCCLLGFLGYSAVIRAEHPQIGSNFWLSILCVVLVFWIGYQLKKRRSTE
jgi:hypothetical protein